MTISFAVYSSGSMTMQASRDPTLHPLAYARPGTVRLPLNRLAILAMLLGTIAVLLVVSLFVPSQRVGDALIPVVATALAAITFGCIALILARRDRSLGTPRRLTSLGAVGVLLGSTSLLLVVYALDQSLSSHDTAPRARCASNLRQIGQAVEMFAAENGGRLPESMADFFTQDLVTAVFVCPSSNDTAAANTPATTQALAAGVEAPGHCSYVYLGKYWMADELTPNVVLAYEPLKDHQGLGMNVLFGDGHVDWLNASAANKMLAELNAGHNPPRQP